jgi:hypothetical protein
MSRAGPSTSGPAPKPAYYATPSPRAPYSTAASDSTRPPASSRPLPNPSVSRKLSARSAQAPVARAASYMTRRRSAGNYPGIAYGDPASMQRRHSRSACPVGRAASRTTVYDARPNAVKFKAKGQTQNGVSLQDAMNGVQLSRSKRYLTSDLHLDANMHLTLKISVSDLTTVWGAPADGRQWPGHQPLRYLVPVKGYNGCVDLPTLLRRIARGCHHYLDVSVLYLVFHHSATNLRLPVTAHSLDLGARAHPPSRGDHVWALAGPTHHSLTRALYIYVPGAHRICTCTSYPHMAYLDVRDARAVSRAPSCTTNKVEHTV